MCQHPLQGFYLVVSAFLLSLYNTSLQLSDFMFALVPLYLFPSRPFAFLLLKVLKVSCKDYNHHAEVCPLSCEVMFQLLSIPLQDGIRFLRNLLPAPHSAFLAVSLLVLPQERYRLTMFRIDD